MAVASATAFDPSSAVPVDSTVFDPSSAVAVDAAPTGNSVPGLTFTPSTTSLGAAAAGVASGVNAGIADIAGLPVDTARNIIELGKAGAGFAYHEVTGNDVPDVLRPNEHPEQDIGSSAWIKDQVRNLGAGSVIDAPAGATPDVQTLHTIGEYASPVVMGAGLSLIHI